MPCRRSPTSPLPSAAVSSRLRAASSRRVLRVEQEIHERVRVLVSTAAPVCMRLTRHALTHHTFSPLSLCPTADLSAAQPRSTITMPGGGVEKLESAIWSSRRFHLSTARTWRCRLGQNPRFGGWRLKPGVQAWVPAYAHGPTRGGGMATDQSAHSNVSHCCIAWHPTPPRSRHLLTVSTRRGSMLTGSTSRHGTQTHRSHLLALGGACYDLDATDPLGCVAAIQRICANPMSGRNPSSHRCLTAAGTRYPLCTLCPTR